MPAEHDVPMATRSHPLHLRSVRADKREADFVASTDALDAYGESVKQNWNLERFTANPVVLYAHQSRELPIGKATQCVVLEGALTCTIRFASREMNPKAEQVWRMVEGGFLRAVSVGFVPNTYRYEKHDGKDVLVLDDNELHEISVVPIPANPEALAKMRTLARATASASTTMESKMEIDLKPRVDKLESELRAEKDSGANIAKELDIAKSTLTALEAQNMALATERDAALTRAAKAEDALIEAEVTALVGVKITPAEKDDFVVLRRSNKELFERFIAQRADAKLLETVIPARVAPPAPAGGGEEIDLLAEAANA